MIDPVTQTANALAATLSGVTLALLGVDYYSLLYALVGAIFALYEAESMGRAKAVFFVVLSTLAGAVLGSGVLAVFGSSNRTLLMAGCIVCGFGAPAILSWLLKNGMARAGARLGLPPAAAEDADKGSRHP